MKPNKERAENTGQQPHPLTQVWVLRSQSLTWPSANAAKTRGTSPNLKRCVQAIAN